MNKRQAFYNVCEYETLLDSKLAPACHATNDKRLEDLMLRYEKAEESEEDIRLESFLNDGDYMRSLWRLYPAKNDREIERKIKQRILITEIEKLLLA